MSVEPGRLGAANRASSAQRIAEVLTAIKKRANERQPLVRANRRPSDSPGSRALSSGECGWDSRDASESVPALTRASLTRPSVFHSSELGHNGAPNSCSLAPRETI